MKFRNLTTNNKSINRKGTKSNKGHTRQINLLTGLHVRRNKKVKPVLEEGILETVNTRVPTTIQGLAIELIGSLTHLPQDAQTILSNAYVLKIRTSSGTSTYTLEGGYSLSIKSKHNKQHIVLKHKKKILIDTVV